MGALKYCVENFEELSEADWNFLDLLLRYVRTIPKTNKPIKVLRIFDLCTGSAHRVGRPGTE